MEKFLKPQRNCENESGRALIERNSSVESKDEEIVVIKEHVVDRKIELTPPLDKSLNVKEIKVRRSRGEKREFPDSADTLKKFKRKKKEESLSGCSASGNEIGDNAGDNEVEILQIHQVSVHPVLQSKKSAKQKDSPTAGNESDAESGEKVVKQTSTRKSKAIANNCKDTFDVLLKFDLEVLSMLDRSLQIIKSHSLLSSKYMSVDTLMDLITLALEKNKSSENVDSEKELSSLITKCTNELCTTPKRSKAVQNILPLPVSPNNKSSVQEESPSLNPTDEGVLEKSPDVEEILEKSESDTTTELPEKTQEQVVRKSGNNFCITNYFKKLKRTVEERDKNERFSCFTTKTDMFLAPKLGGELTGERREKFEDAFVAQNASSRYLTELSRKCKREETPSSNPTRENKSDERAENSGETPVGLTNSSANVTANSGIEKTDSNGRKRVTLTRVDKPQVEAIEAVCRTKAKLFQFHDNRRPPYWGTWRRKSESVGPRRPFEKDKSFNYEIDSDDEWEEEEEPGESLHGSDDEKEPEEDYEVDNDFFVPHGYLSDDENPEKEGVSSKTKLELLEEQFTSEQKQKMRKMTPIVFGTFWVYKGLPPEGTLYQDLQIEKLQYVPWTSVPVEIEEEPTSTVKKSKQKVFPDEEIPNLIKMIHGSPQNANHLARKFLLYWETERIPDGNRHPLTKVCVQKKIKELAAWQTSQETGKMCWLVPRETREEFGAEVEKKTPEKKPRKCFIWKFVRKAEKAPGGGNPPKPPQTPIEPEVVILES